MTIIIEEAFYLDDHLAGAHTIEEKKEKVKMLREFFKRGGFNLRKFISSEPRILEDLDSDLVEKGSKQIEENENTKT